MADLEVFLSNPGHHVETFAPVVGYVTERGVTARVHSFCELRGYPSPAGSFAPAEVLPLWPRLLRRRARVSSGGPGASSRRRLPYELAWRLIIGPRLSEVVNASSRLAVLPNDAAFPYDRLAAFLRRHRIPYVLVQEGIRFPMPAERVSSYGLGGARALAVWGEASAEHFRGIGVDAARIHVTGAPRFDRQPPASWPPQRTARQGAVALLLITNPIDAQGFCKPTEKTALVARFVAHLRDALSRGLVTLTVRPHPGESWEKYAAALTRSDRTLVSFDATGNLDDALAATDVAVVMASTVGLEALRRGVPLSVLPTPGHGYVHDYVERQAALGVSWDDALASRLIRHASPSMDYSSAVERYLGHHLAGSGRATRHVGQLMIDLLDDE